MLSVSDLRKDDENVRHQNKKYYKQLLQLIYDKIKELNKRKFKTLNYTLPLFYPGFPFYDSNVGLKYIYKKLIKGGFDVTLIDERSLTIYWT